MTRTHGSILTAILLASIATQAAAFDLTGTYIGVRACKLVDAGAKSSFKDVFTADILQSGNAIGIVANFVGGPEPYVGLANILPAKPDKGEFAMIHCGTNDVAGDGSTYDSIGLMQVATKPGKTKATIKGMTIFSDAGTVDVSAGTCKLKFTRTGTISTLSTTDCPVH